jgi:hypothetical protein
MERIANFPVRNAARHLLDGVLAQSQSNQVSADAGLQSFPKVPPINACRSLSDNPRGNHEDRPRA